ncbi:MAG: hypothetical protein ACRCU6_02200 [Fusobacteriaceae bacterium]
MFVIIPNKKLCCAYRCKSEKSKKDRFCSKHRKRYTKEIDPAQYYYWNLKSNAKRRKKDFNLTLEEFRIFCNKTGYLDKRGKTKNSYSIDRINPKKGYSLDNIQMLKLGENVSKYHREDKNNLKDDLPF